MPTLTITPAQPSTGEPIVVDGAGFKPSAPITLTIREAGVVVKMTTGPAGAFKSDKVIDWAPSRVGIFTVVADDGTDTVSLSVQVWT
jgi:hypothetical protein